MSGLYAYSFSPARTVSPQTRSTTDIDSQYLAELLAEHQKLGPFMQVLPICSRLLNQEIIRVSGMVPNQGFGDRNWLQHRSHSPMATPNLISNAGGTGFGGWSGHPEEEEKMRGKAGYEHLNDPLHVLIEAELPANVIDTRLRHAHEVIEELLKPVDESQDYYKRQQLRELAMLNSGLREDSPHPSGSISPLYNRMK